MTDRISSGSDRLDTVLGGGLPRNAICLIIGLPGSGKTIFAQQCIYANASAERPAVYLSTVSEPVEKMLRFGQGLSFFDTEAVGSRVVYDDLGNVLGERGLEGVLDSVRKLIQERHPSIIVIDSFKAMRVYAADDSKFRQFLHHLTGLVSAFPVTSLWVGEYEESEIASAPEFAVADVILAFGSSQLAHRTSRELQVLKLRGGSFLTGKHAYRISPAGISAFPRLAEIAGQPSYTLEPKRSSSGIQALDDMLADGYWPGSATLIAGPTGAGKTLMGLHFVFSGARDGEPGLIATLQEHPTQLERIVHNFGWSLNDDKVTLMYHTPVDLYIDEWVYELLDTVEAVGAKRVLIDSLGDLQAATADMTRFREYVYTLLHRCSREGVSVMMTHEIPDLFGASRLTEYGASHLADNVVLLQYTGFENAAVGRTLTVLKTRATSHDPRVRSFQITPKGITLDDVS